MSNKAAAVASGSVSILNWNYHGENKGHKLYRPDFSPAWHTLGPDGFMCRTPQPRSEIAHSAQCIFVCSCPSFLRNVQQK